MPSHRLTGGFARGVEEGEPFADPVIFFQEHLLAARRPGRRCACGRAFRSLRAAHSVPRLSLLQEHVLAVDDRGAERTHAGPSRQRRRVLKPTRLAAKLCKEVAVGTSVAEFGRCSSRERALTGEGRLEQRPDVRAKGLGTWGCEMRLVAQDLCERTGARGRVGGCPSQLSSPRSSARRWRCRVGRRTWPMLVASGCASGRRSAGAASRRTGQGFGYPGLRNAARGPGPVRFGAAGRSPTGGRHARLRISQSCVTTFVLVGAERAFPRYGHGFGHLGLQYAQSGVPKCARHQRAPPAQGASSLMRPLPPLLQEPSPCRVRA
jgi:hypothetical protein